MNGTSTKVTDPVCGMSFDSEKAVAQATYNGTTYYFCTETCKKQFDVGAARYVEPCGVPQPAVGTWSDDWIG